jgi:hypothetical protein
VKLTYRLDGEKEDSMNIIIATLIVAGVPAWQMIQNLEHNKIGAAAANAIQIAVYILLMRAVM